MDGGVGGSSTTATTTTGSGGGDGGMGGGLPTCRPPTQATTLITEATGVRQVRPFGGYVYWLTSGAVRRMPKCGGAAQTLAENQPGEGGRVLQVTPDGVFWQSSGSSVRRMGHNGDGGSVLASSSEISGLHVDAEHAYFYLRPTNDLGGVLRVPLAGGAATPLWPSGVSPGYVGPLTGDDHSVFHIVGVGSPFGALQQIDKVSGASTELLHMPLPASVAPDATNLYATFVQSVNEVRRIDIGTGEVEVVASGQATPFTVAVDDTHLFWTNGGNDTTPPAIMRLSKTGGEPEILLEGGDLDDPRALALDDEAIYWGDRQSGVIGWMAKP
jgi:hypothetical protein